MSSASGYNGFCRGLKASPDLCLESRGEWTLVQEPSNSKADRATCHNQESIPQRTTVPLANKNKLIRNKLSKSFARPCNQAPVP
eukprot:5526588-Amphidinium_carterae.1